MGNTILTAVVAKQMSIDLWQWLAEHPGKIKHDWPRYNELKYMKHDCPLCEYHRMSTTQCGSCPLSVGSNLYGENCAGGAFEAWWANLIQDPGESQRQAENILELIEAWDITEEDE